MRPYSKEPRLWKRLFGYCEVSEDGCWLWTMQTVNGYARIGIDGVPVRVNRLSWELHYGPIPEGLLICHRCDNRHCIRPGHLFPDTHQGNSDDMKRKGRQRRGEQHHSAKLTEDDVRKIRKLYAGGGVKQYELGNIFDVGVSAIHRIIKRKIWKDVR